MMCHIIAYFFGVGGEILVLAGYFDELIASRARARLTSAS